MRMHTIDIEQLVMRHKPLKNPHPTINSVGYTAFTVKDKFPYSSRQGTKNLTGAREYLYTKLLCIIIWLLTFEESKLQSYCSTSIYPCTFQMTIKYIRAFTCTT